jgi:hypothetical protein
MYIYMYTVYMSMNMHTYVYTYICIYICMYIYRSIFVALDFGKVGVIKLDELKGASDYVEMRYIYIYDYVEMRYFNVYIIPLSYTSKYSPPPTYRPVLLFRTLICFFD